MFSNLRYIKAIGMSKVKITQQGIKRALSRIGVEEAVAEFIWNGFDAKATEVRLSYQGKEAMFGLLQVTELQVTDNGTGIPADLLEKKFTPFLESEKSRKLREENIGLEGKNGYGRLTFYKFATEATWETCYQNDQGHFQYTISIKARSLDNYDETPVKSSRSETGTTVRFTGLPPQFTGDYLAKKLRSFILNEFAWYLEVNKHRDVKLYFQEELLQYDALIAEKEDFQVVLYKDAARKEPVTFACTFIRWRSRMNDEFSRFYFLNEESKLKKKTTTRLNKKGDHFYHSVIIKSPFFDNFSYYDDEEEDKHRRPSLFTEHGDYKVFGALMQELNAYLRKKRKPFLHDSADILIRDLEKAGVMPVFGKNSWDKVRKSEFEALIKGLYEAEPALFVKLNPEQKKTFLHLMNLLLDSDERDKMFDILQNVVELDNDDRTRLRDILKTTKLTHIVHALKLVQDRLLALHQIKQVVFNHELKANERDHLQKIMEDHYWILGEQYSLVCAAEGKFETALRKYLYLLRGEDKPVTMDHPDKLKEMDIFLVRQQYGATVLNNVVVELKSPTTVKRLTHKELEQIKTYMRVILSTDEFNAQSNCTWEFYLIGQDHDDAIAQEKSNAQHHGEKDLVFKVNNYKIYVKKWSEVFIDAELRLNWLNEKLKMERDKLAEPIASAADAVIALQASSAVQPTKVQLPAISKA
jgi:hypothetical protein